MNILSFDVEDWFHLLEHESTCSATEWNKFPSRIHESVNRILNELSKSDTKATFFCLGWIAERYPEVIKLIDSMGHEIGSHTYSHQLVTSQTADEFDLDLGKSVHILEDLTGKKIRSFRAPGFSISRKTPWVIEILNKYGIEMDCSICPATHSHGGEKTFTGKKPQLISYKGMIIKEFPLSVWDVNFVKVPFSGGGYFRLFPYWLTSRLMQRSEYVMSYFHPRDFDPNQPLLNDLSPIRKFKSYYGLSFSHKKLSNMLQDFEFLRVCDADNNISWTNVPIFHLG